MIVYPITKKDQQLQLITGNIQTDTHHPSTTG